MTNYLAQLLADLRHAADNPPAAPTLLENPYDMDVPDYILEWEQAKPTPLSRLFGIPAEALPPAGQWTEAQLESLLAAIAKLWQAYGCDPYFPEDVPIETKYEQFRRYWDCEIDYTALSGGTFDFCECDPAACPYGELCPCLGIEVEDMADYSPTGGANELPF